MKKYIWCWAYEDGCSIYAAESLKDIVEIYVKARYDDSDSLSVKEVDDCIDVEFNYGELKTHYVVEKTENDVCKFLHYLSCDMGIKEYFSISKTKILMET